MTLSEAAQRQELKAKNGPAELAGKSDADALAYLKAQKEKRTQIQGRIDKLSKERDAQLAAGAKDAFDEKVVQALKDRAAAQGVKY